MAGGTASRLLLADWVLASSWTYRSGAPRNPGVGSDVNGDGNSSTDRPFMDGAIAGRNSWVGPDYLTIDLRLSKRIQTGGRTSALVLIEVFNLLNRVNYTGINMTWGTGLTSTATYGQYTEANNPRQLQIGVKFEF